ncbi:VOC family protein [Mycobacterium sp. ACS4331]|uniref:VOC family protein n=1 Tax=Mycobacterium sp. ACS4331 TaxID=1834121 RepID=UPI0007FD7408|nr:VOC family protein [Mycobacterium sp. ACS4331]OBF11297.1 bleomycin resistance protein [Mycobacterium sp. ACS4331]
MNPDDLYHVGLIVDDVEAAAARLTAAAGYEWTQPVQATLSVTADGNEMDVPFSFVYSLQAPHLELVQAVPGSVWTAAPGQAAHHLGYWVDDLASAAAQLESSGFRLEARPTGDELSQFAYYIDPVGVRIEIVDRGLFPDWPGFLNAMRRG